MMVQLPGSGFLRRFRDRWLAAGLIAFLVLAGCQIGPRQEPPGRPGESDTTSAAGDAGGRQAQTPAGAGDATRSRPTQAYTAGLVLTPSRAEVGATVEVRGTGYPAGADVELIWYTVEGSYELDGIDLVGQRFDATSRVLSTMRADQSGSIASALVVPDDFGGAHDVRGRVNGEEIAQAGLTVVPVFSLTPREGPVGTPIDVRVAGVDWRSNINTWEILYDNRFAGFMSAVTTKGVAVGRIRAAGPVGDRVVSVWHNSIYPTPFLNYKDGAFKDVPGAEFKFRVTGDPGPSEPLVERSRATGNPFPANLPPGPSGPAKLSLSTDQGTVGQPLTLRGTGLPPNANLTLRWGTMEPGEAAMSPTARRAEPWRLVQPRSLGNLTSGPDGTFQKELVVPDVLGGLHRLDVVADGKALAGTYLSVQPSLVSFGPRRLRAGEEVKIHLSGLGAATTNNNVYAVTYDNSHIGYICGSSAGGDVEFSITATGAAGTHLIDLYPFIYRSQDQEQDSLPRVYGVPQLTYADDHPWRITPAIRLAVEIVE